MTSKRKRSSEIDIDAEPESKKKQKDNVTIEDISVAIMSSVRQRGLEKSC